MNYDIFISYKRRGTSSATAAYIYDLLTKKGYSVFFDRKEIRQGKFDTQLLTHIQGAQDIIILLEDGSLSSCFSDMKEAYKTDWFCMEIMHALQNKKRIIPVLLEGYKMPDAKDLPPEMASLTLENAISLDIGEIDEFYQKYLIDKGYLASKPRNLFLSQSDGTGVADFLFYSEGDCDIFEFGNQIGTINSNVDEEHPYCYPVKRSGEHKFRCLNNDTFEEIWITETIESNTQKYVNIKWSLHQNLWDLTDEDIEKQDDSRMLYFWGTGFFQGTTRHEPDIHRAFLCMKRSAEMWNVDARDFLVDHVRSILNKGVSSSDRIPWYEMASEFGSDDAMELLGRCYDEGIDVPQDLKLALKYGAQALDLRLNKNGENDAAVAMSYHNLGRVNYAMHKYNKSLECYEKAVKIREALFGQENIETANSYYNISLVYCEKKKYQLALSAARKALEAYRNVVGDSNAVTLGAFERVVDIYSFLDDPENAILSYEQGMKAGAGDCAVCLGKMYLLGLGVEKSFDRAYDYLTKAAEMESVWAKNELADLFCSGEYCPQDYSKALLWYKEAAEAGNFYSMYRLGLLYQDGLGCDQDYEQALFWYSQAAEGGDMVDAMAGIADLYRMGCLDDPTHALAFEWYRKAAEGGSPYGQSRLGDMYSYGVYVDQDASNAFKWYMKAARQGFDTAYSLLGTMYYEGNGVDQDFSKAKEWYEKAAELEHPFALFRLGEMYREGQGVSVDYAEALERYRKAADGGNTRAMDEIGDMYSSGTGVDQDYDAAYEWYVRSGSRYALAEVGDMFLYGKGREVDARKAYEWHLKAAEEGNCYSMEQIGSMYRQGDLGQIDFKTAFDWYLKAAEAGSSYSMRCLGLMYSEGKGVETDFAASCDWFLKASEEGDGISMKCLGEVYRDGKGVYADLDKAMEWFEKAVDAGNARAAYDIAMLYSGEYAHEKDIDKCISWHTKAFSMGCPDSALELAMLYQEGTDVPKNLNLAIEWHKRASEAGMVRSDNELGNIFLAGDEGLEQNVDEAILWYGKAAEKGNAYAMAQLGDCYSKAEYGIQDFGRAFEWYRKSAEEGNAYGMFSLSQLYESGDAGEKDINLAIYWCEKAAEHGDPYPISHLSFLYQTNPDITDFDKALFWAKRLLEICEKDGGDFGFAYNAIAWCYCKLERYAEALDPAHDSMACYEEAGYSLDTANTLDTLGVAYFGLGRIEEARKMFEKCFKVYDIFDDQEGMQRTRERLEGLEEGVLKGGD